MIYLNYAALCPTRAEAQQEIGSTLDEFRSLLYSEAGLQWYEKKVTTCRQDVADLLNVSDPSSIAFVPNASMGSHLALSFIDWKPGDGILTTTHENPSVVREISWLAHRGVHVSTIDLPSPDDLVATIEERISTQSIRAVILSHVSHVDGRILPVFEIGKMTKMQEVLLIVDGAQAVGHIPLNLGQLDIDFYFFPGHKWCQGPLGTGACVFRDSYLNKNPSFAQAGLGWNGTPAGRFEIGTQNIGAIAGLAKACKLKKEEGLKATEKEKIRQSVKTQIEKLKKFLIKEWEGPHAPGMLTFQCLDSRSYATLTRTLVNQFGIVVKEFTEYPAGDTPAIRISWFGEKDTEEVLFLVDAMKKGT